MRSAILKFLLNFCFLIFLFFPAEAECRETYVLAMVKKDSSETAYIKKGKRIEVVTAKANYEGKVKCIGNNSILVGNDWILLNDILLIVDPNNQPKVQDALAWPMIGSGLLIGGVGTLMAAGNPDFEDSEDTRSFVIGLTMIAAGTGLTYGGIKLKSKNTVNDDIYYSPKTHDFIVKQT